MRSIGGASSHITATVVPRFVAREKQRGPLQRSARARSRGEKERLHGHIACAVGGWRARGGVWESQRDVNFVSHWCSRREQMETGEVRRRCRLYLQHLPLVRFLSSVHIWATFGWQLGKGKSTCVLWVVVARTVGGERSERAGWTLGCLARRRGGVALRRLARNHQIQGATRCRGNLDDTG